jgi:hypothetical protein
MALRAVAGDALCLVEHSMSYSNPTELQDRISNLAMAAGWPRRGNE